ncbi:MAG: RCC1 domain-containing protein, partial [Coriobacteriia bacterium]|nr:RCC1 domain-containing protein [Coriobacteriia bacterium]
MTVCPVRDNVAPYPKNHSRIGWIGSGRHAGPSPKTGSRLRVCLSAVLCLAIALSAVPGTVFAADDAATARALAADGIAATCTLATDEIAPDLGANDAALLSTGFVRWKIVSAGRGFHSLGIKEDGTLWAWGLNSCGQLGDGTGGDGTNANDKNAPVQ